MDRVGTCSRWRWGVSVSKGPSEDRPGVEAVPDPDEPQDGGRSDHPGPFSLIRVPDPTLGMGPVLPDGLRISAPLAQRPQVIASLVPLMPIRGRFDWPGHG